jgi:hypothetical protein
MCYLLLQGNFCVRFCSIQLYLSDDDKGSNCTDLAAIVAATIPWLTAITQFEFIVSIIKICLPPLWACIL